MYLEAWNNLFELQPTVAGKWDELVLDKKWNILNTTIPSSFFIAPQQSSVSIDFFGRESRLALLKREYPDINVSSWNSRYNIPPSQWRRWWPFLRKIRRRYPEAENSAHLLSLDSWRSGDKLGGREDSTFINNRSRSCVLCEEEEIESLEHLLVNCTFSRQVWNILEPDTPIPPLSTFVCPPSVHKSLLKSISSQVAYLHRIFKLSRSRRFGKLPLEPLEAEHAEKVAKAISSYLASPASSSFFISSTVF
jgi:hypothetical protein